MWPSSAVLRGEGEKIVREGVRTPRTSRTVRNRWTLKLLQKQEQGSLEKREASTDMERGSGDKSRSEPAAAGKM